MRRHRLGFVEDPSNIDTRLARNRVRYLLAPVLGDAFEGSEQRLCASAVRAQEAAACLRELAELDLQGARAADGQLQVAAWQRLSEARRANLLRAWLSGFAPAGVPDSLVQRLLQELPRASAARWPLGIGELFLYRGRLRCVDVAPCRAGWCEPRQVAGSRACSQPTRRVPAAEVAGQLPRAARCALGGLLAGAACASLRTAPNARAASSFQRSRAGDLSADR